MSVEGKVVVITGAGRGLGKSLAQNFAGAGAKLVLAARNENELEKLKRELKTEVLNIPTDVRKENDCKNLIERAVKQIENLTTEQLDDIIHTNLMGTIY
ncbi:MAG: SDR family NAD(P)-dependent oxidoreductase, partial [Candidatus Aenigmarchaeota archaeon]|nr:SDR family NAD(P)-dependent oxidoreductase [Candidatus Aenigmarchaeota archaeon]